MKFKIILSTLVHLSALAFASVALADVTNSLPNSASGGSGIVSAIQADDGLLYSAPKGSTINVGEFPAVGGDISSVVLHVKFSVDPGGYSGTHPILVNGVSTPLIPVNGDTQRTASVNITAGNFRVNTWPEITALAITFANNDGGTSQSVHFDHAYLVITHSTPVFAPPTWSDEFDDSGPPNPAVWTFEQGFVRNSELQWYQSNNAWQQGGNLIIEGRREQIANPNYVAGSSDWRTSRQFAQYSSSSIKSQGKFSFQYGRMQVRAKIPCFPGTWPAIWTLGNSGEWPSNGECDVLEYYSPDSVLANLAKGTNTRWSAAWDAVKKPVSTFTGVNPNWRTQYHVWTMQWDAENIRLYIDNHLMNTTAQSWLVNPVTTWGPKNPFKQPHYLLLNLALGGAGGNPANTVFPLRYEVDHVRVWEGLTDNQAPTNIALSSSSVPEGLPSGTVVGNLTATDVDAAEVHSFSLVTGTGSTHNSSFEIVFNSDQTKTSVLRTKAVLSASAGATRSIRVRVTDIEGVTYDKVLTVQLDGQFVIEVTPATLTVAEGSTNTFAVRLRVPPSQTTTVNVSRLSGDADLNVTSGSSLIFTPANATVWQTVTLSAAADADRINGTATFRCQDASGTFLNATVLADEADSEPILEATIGLANLAQTYDRFAKSVIVTTTPAGLSHDLTYGGQFMMPTDAGTYEIVVTITDPDYVGSITGTLVVAKAAQTISFPALGPVPDHAAPIALTATSSSDLPVSYTHSNTNVATLSGNTLTIVRPGSTTITASQEGDDNHEPAVSVPRLLTVFRANPLAVATGSYRVLFDQSLTLNGGDSLPSDGQAITLHSWDLNNDGIFGDVTGAAPTVSFANFTTTWGMVDGFNSIALQVTDSAGKTSTVSTTVEVVGSLTWDSNAAAALQTDGAGEWTSALQWWNGTSNTTWTSGDDAIFGNNGAGGAVTLAGPTTVNTLTFNSFTGTYTLGTVGQVLTLNNGITLGAGAGATTIVSPIALGAAQSWTNNGSASLLTIGTGGVTNHGFPLTVGGMGNTAISGAIGGAGGLTKSGVGSLSLSGSSSYSGTTTVSAGTLALSSANTISAATSVAATGTLQLGHATSLGASTMTLASGATLQLRNDSNTSFTAPIATPTGAVTYNFDVNNAASAVTGKTLSRGNITFATSTANQINVTGGNSYTLGLGTLSSPSGSSGPWAFTVNATTAAVTIANFSAGSFGNALALQGGNAITLSNFEMGSNSTNSLTVSGSGTVVTLGATRQTNSRAGGSVAYTLTSGTLNLTTTTSLANVRLASGTLTAPTFAINGGTLNNTSGSLLTLAASPASGTVAGSPTITLGGNFAFGTALSTSANNLHLGTGPVTNGGNRTLTLNGTGTTLTFGGAMTNAVAGTQTSTINGTGNTLVLGAYNLSNSATARTGVFTGSGNVTITGIVANSSGGTPASSLTYSGAGTLTLGGQNAYTGNTTVSSGTLAINSTGGIYTAAYTATPVVTVSSGATLQVAAWAYGANGGLESLDAGAARLLINGGRITYTGTGEGEGNQNNGRLFTIGTGGATLHAAGTGTWFIEPYASYDLTTGQVIPSGLTLTLSGSAAGKFTKRISGTGGRLTKSGLGTWTLAGANSYTGATAIQGGTLAITGATQSTSAITFSGGGVLGLDTATPVTAASATVDFTGQSVLVTGPTGAPSYTLLTALSIPGTAPTLAVPVPGYTLQVISNQLRLVQTGGASAYDTWKTTNAPTGNPNEDFDSDGVSNILEFMLGGLATTDDLAKLPTVSQVGGNLELNFTCLQVANRGGASLNLQYSKDLGITDPWTSHELTVPDTAGVVGPVTFSIPSVNADPKLVNLKASIPASEAAPGTKLFGRLMAQP